jgi:putative hydrolase of the HAD superfamily
MSERWPIHTIVFDLDDTLYLERDFVLSGFAAVDRWLQRERGVRGFAGRAGRRFAEGERGRIFDAVLGELGLDAASAEVDRLVAVYREHEPEIALLPDAAEALAWAGTSFQLALITDGYAAVQRRKIRALALEACIPCRVVTDDWGREFWKPSPAPYRRVMEHFPGLPEGYVYVGDNPRKDFLAPRALGWRTVRVRRPGGEHAGYSATAEENAEREIASLRELETFLVPGDAFSAGRRIPSS